MAVPANRLAEITEAHAKVQSSKHEILLDLWAANAQSWRNG
jgi:hypothetical protein